MKPCANLTWLFKEVPFMERFAAAADNGFSAVEILSPYDVPANQIADELVRHGLDLALINCPPPNYTGGEPGYAAVPGDQVRFQSDFKRTLRYASVLGPQHIHIMAGVASGPEARATFIENLRYAADAAPDQSLTIEPINQTDMPGYFLADYAEAEAILKAVDARNLHLQFDAYHAQIITGDALAAWSRYGHLARHIQIAGYPGRHEPTVGEIDYGAFFRQLRHDKYDGFMSGEYAPENQTEVGLEWLSL